MTRNRRIATAMAVFAVVACASTAVHADDAALLKKMADLEKKQAAMQKEMDELRHELDAAKKAPSAPASEEPRVAEVERKQNVITEEVRKIRDSLSLPETKELKSEYGLGPAASKVYGVSKGLSIGGYGEFNYKNSVSDSGNSSDQFDMLRLVLYTGYKFNDWILFNAETEFEHQHVSEDGDGEVNVEFASIDMFFDPKINFRGGLVLVPMGFMNEIHEPPFYHGNRRPLVETNIIPTTWSTGGVGLFGELAPGLTYRTYAVVGLNASGFTAEEGLREGRQEGIETANDFAWVGRMDYSPLDILTIGGSAYVGNSGQGQAYGTTGEHADVLTQVYEGHAQLRTHGLEMRVLGSWVGIDDAAALSSDPNINPHVADPAEPDQPIASSMYGVYGEIAYDVLPLVMRDTEQYLAPWFRYEHFNTQDDVPFGFSADDNFDRSAYEVGIDYKPHPDVVFKVDYRNQTAEQGDAPDEIRVGAGFAY